jgi:hypothetical protein
LGVSLPTVGKRRGQYALHGFAGLPDGERSGGPKAGLELTAAEREQLTRWVRRAKTAQALAMRAKIALACAGGAEGRQRSSNHRLDTSPGSRRRLPKRKRNF